MIKFAESHVDVRIYDPVSLPGARQSRFVGKKVHVVWQQPVFSLFGGGGKDGPLHELVRWYGYVVEFDMQVDHQDLKHIPKENK